MNEICSRCVMDSTVPNIIFDEEGVCNYCKDFESSLLISEVNNKSQMEEEANVLVSRIKREGRGKPYDCIVGLSGGVDSAWVLYLAIKMGLRPLAVHMDNGWNSELAQNNIEGIVRSLNVHLHTHVIDWSEYRQLMQAFFDADVVDVELLYDNAMLAVNYKLASDHGVNWILGGTNITTEGMKMPQGWNWFKYDSKNIRSIASSGGISIFKTFPLISAKAFFYNTYIKGVKWISFLDYFNYNKNDALNFLEASCGYKRYPYKHYESVFTRFYQGYILPAKFGIDKRKVHLSTLIISGQITRDDALLKLSEIPYPSMMDMENDMKYFLKKMKWSDADLKSYIARPPVEHSRYSNDYTTLYKLRWLYRYIKRFGRSSW